MGDEPANRRNENIRLWELILRYVALLALCFWMGGFTFYAGVVIHVGHRVFGSAREVGFQTQQVTIWLNRSGAIALGILPLHFWFQLRKTSRAIRHIALATLFIMIGIQVALFRLHPGLDQLLDASKQAISDRSAFRHRHLVYMNLSTVMWCAALAHLWVMLAGWSRAAIPASRESGGACGNL